jgi:Ca2+-binding RTX toxin-like protein
VEGGWGWDRISGGNGVDVTHGGAGRDRIFANLGADVTYGDDGGDELWALAIKDVDTTNGPDTSGDTLVGGNGNDRLRTRDGELDRVDCGSGRDRALLDAQDVIVDATPENPNGSCERVVREAPDPNDTRTEDGQQSPQDDGTDG